ncbi:MAG: sigma-70 family RNA polymerase sigma factor [Candidatus Omnitrophica bacterium]|nr:sigma-70 family RNA polymerase sigma factor [Candidatus Omnitrophota bacterium]
MEVKTDEILISEYQQGNAQALEELFGRYKKAIFNYALRLLGDRADAEDIVAESFMILVTNKMAYQPQAKFSTWFYRVAHNMAISRIRRRKYSVSMWFKKNDGDDFEEWDVADTKDLPQEELIKKEKNLAVRKAIQKLPEDQKEALILREYQELSYHEISVILDCSLENVKILIFRAREALRTELASVMSEDSHE